MFRCDQADWGQHSIVSSNKSSDVSNHILVVSAYPHIQHISWNTAPVEAILPNLCRHGYSIKHMECSENGELVVMVTIKTYGWAH